MTQNEFKKKVKQLHEVFGVPYTEIGKKIGYSGQYISLMINNQREITPQVLMAAEQAEIFKMVG